jgi:ankyrin repeat protein
MDEVLHGNVEHVVQLIEDGHNVYETNDRGETPLHYAVLSTAPRQVNNDKIQLKPRRKT